MACNLMSMEASLRGSTTLSEVSSFSDRASSLGDVKEELQQLASTLGLASVNDLLKVRFKVDRKKLEAMIQGANTAATTADGFFEQISTDTRTLIKWPKKLKIGAKSNRGADPHVTIAGLPDGVKSAKERVLNELESRVNRVTMKLDVSYTDHSHVIGKGGLSIKRVMDDTQCHIHFPDSNRSNPYEKSNQVSICGDIHGVEKARSRIRNLVPLIFCFELPILNSGQTPPDQNSPYIVQVCQQYNVQVMFRTQPKLHATLVLIKGAEWEVEQVKAATVLLIKCMCGAIANEIQVQMNLEISPLNHPVVVGTESVNLKNVMRRTRTKIIFPDVDDPYIPVLKKSHVTITGDVDNVYLARQQLIGSLPIVLIFDLPETQPLIKPDRITQTMQALDVAISVRQKPRQNSQIVIVKGVERNIAKIYEARHVILNLTEPKITVEIPDTYHTSAMHQLNPSPTASPNITYAQQVRQRARQSPERTQPADATPSGLKWPPGFNPKTNPYYAPNGPASFPAFEQIAQQIAQQNQQLAAHQNQQLALANFIISAGNNVEWLRQQNVNVPSLTSQMFGALSLMDPAAPVANSTLINDETIRSFLDETLTPENVSALNGSGNGMNVNGLNGNALNGNPLTGNALNGNPLNGNPLNGNALNGNALNGNSLHGNGLSSLTNNGHISNGNTLLASQLIASNQTAPNGSGVSAGAFNGTTVSGGLTSRGFDASVPAIKINASSSVMSNLSSMTQSSMNPSSSMDSGFLSATNPQNWSNYSLSSAARDPDKRRRNSSTSSLDINALLGEMMHTEFKTPQSPLESMTWEQRRVAAREAIQSPIRGYRVPTDTWSGFGLSATLPSITSEDGKLNTSSEADDDVWSSPTTTTIKSADGSSQPSSTTPASRLRLNSSNLLEHTPSHFLAHVQNTKWNDLATLLASCGLEKYVQTFQSHEVDLMTFQTLTERDLIDMGIRMLGARKKMLLIVAELNKRSQPFSPTPGSQRRFNKGSSSSNQSGGDKNW